MIKEKEQEQEQEEVIGIDPIKPIKGYSLDIQKAIDNNYNVETTDELDEYLTEVTIEINYDDDPMKILITDDITEIEGIPGPHEYVISLGQLNRSLYHLTKSSAKEEVKQFQSFVINPPVEAGL